MGLSIKNNVLSVTVLTQHAMCHSSKSHYRSACYSVQFIASAFSVKINPFKNAQL